MIWVPRREISHPRVPVIISYPQSRIETFGLYVLVNAGGTNFTILHEY
jgi:hypothetical protein